MLLPITWSYSKAKHLLNTQHMQPNIRATGRGYIQSVRIAHKSTANWAYTENIHQQRIQRATQQPHQQQQQKRQAVSNRHTTHETLYTRTDSMHGIVCWSNVENKALVWRRRLSARSLALALSLSAVYMVYSLAHSLRNFRYWYLRRAAVSISLYFQLGCCFSSMNMDRKFVAIIQTSKKTESVFVC